MITQEIIESLEDNKLLALYGRAIDLLFKLAIRNSKVYEGVFSELKSEKLAASVCHICSAEMKKRNI